MPSYVNVNNIHIKKGEPVTMRRLGEMLGRCEAKLDEWGKPAWIAAMVLGFILIWPLGLAILFYMIWSGRMGCSSSRWGRRSGAKAARNSAFEEYRQDTLRRLEEEQEAFSSFLDRLRHAKDRAEFDQFKAEQSRPANDPQPA